MYTKLKTYKENILVPRNIEGRPEKLKQEIIKLLSQEIINDSFQFTPLMYDIPEHLVKVKAINGNLDCSHLNLTKLPTWFKNIEIINGLFFCNNNKLTTLENCPQIINGNFYCYNNELTSLKGSPKKIEKDFNCVFNDLITLEGCTQYIGGGFYCKHNKLKSLEHGPKYVGFNYYCSNNMIVFEKPEDCEIKGTFYNR